ncbi:hypothetical protein [Nitrosomonas sp.]|uniref:hypothetical protein n=1 Tax=Nitrosomonas sp. TaxID=42353 RepID=UPI00374CA5DF
MLSIDGLKTHIPDTVLDQSLIAPRTSLSIRHCAWRTFWRNVLMKVWILKRARRI